jgi:hypothetical protein
MFCGNDLGACQDRVSLIGHRLERTCEAQPIFRLTREDALYRTLIGQTTTPRASGSHHRWETWRNHLPQLWQSSHRQRFGVHDLPPTATKLGQEGLATLEGVHAVTTRGIKPTFPGTHELPIRRILPVVPEAGWVAFTRRRCGGGNGSGPISSRRLTVGTRSATLANVRGLLCFLRVTCGLRSDVWLEKMRRFCGLVKVGGLYLQPAPSIITVARWAYPADCRARRAEFAISFRTGDCQCAQFKNRLPCSCWH